MHILYICVCILGIEAGYVWYPGTNSDYVCILATENIQKLKVWLKSGAKVWFRKLENNFLLIILISQTFNLVLCGPFKKRKSLFILLARHLK